MKTLSIDQLRERLTANSAVIFDVRGDVEYELAHIPGAKTAPLGSLVFRVANVMDADSCIGLYGAGDDPATVLEAAERLKNLGMHNVQCYLGGLEGWRAAGLRVTESVHARVHARGPVRECRPLIVDRETAYGGAFRDAPTDTAGAGG